MVGVRMFFCVLIGAKTRGRGRGESAQVMLGREIIYICYEFIWLWTASSYTEESTMVLVWFPFYGQLQKGKFDFS